MSLSVILRPDENGLNPVINVASAWSVTQDSAANTALTATKALVAGKRHYITAIEVVISGGSAGGDIAIELRSGSTKVWKEVIGTGTPSGERAGIVFTHPIELTISQAANLYVSAGGAGVIATANMAGYTA